MKFPKFKISRRARLLFFSLMGVLFLIVKENNSRFIQTKVINAYLLIFGLLFCLLIYTLIDTRKQQSKKEASTGVNIKGSKNSNKASKLNFIETNPDKIKEKPYVRTLFLDNTNGLVSARYKHSPKQPRKPMNQELTPEARKSLIGDLQKNSIDEVILIRIYERFFDCDVQIVNGHIHTYECKFDTHTATLDYPTLKDDLLKALHVEHHPI